MWTKTIPICKKCGENRTYVLDFHHINPNEKEFDLGEGEQQASGRPEPPPHESGADVVVSVCPVCPEPETPTAASDLPGHTEVCPVCPPVCPEPVSVCPEAQKPSKPPANPPAAHPPRMTIPAIEPPADLVVQLVSLRNRNPQAHASALARMIDPDGRLALDGRKVAGWLEWINQQPDDFEDLAA
jgi:hypothetical protein